MPLITLNFPVFFPTWQFSHQNKAFKNTVYCLPILLAFTPGLRPSVIPPQVNPPLSTLNDT